MKRLPLAALTFVLVAWALVPLAQAQSHFTSCTSGTDHDSSLAIPTSIAPTIGGDPFENGDEIAVFTPEGICAGVAVWDGVENVALYVWGNDSQTATKDGFVSGDSLFYRVWDASAMTEYGGTVGAVVLSYSSDETYYRTDGRYSPNAMYWLTSLSVILPPGQVMLLSPSDGATAVMLDLSLTWSAVSDANTYDLALSTSPDFQSYHVLDTDLTDTTYSTTGLSAATTYYWQVRALNVGGAGPCSDVFSFTTLSPPAAPALSAPSDGAVDQSTSPTLSWQAVADAETYELEVSTHLDFSNVDVTAQTGLTTNSYALSGLENDQTYYWRVRGVNAAGPGSFATPFSLTTTAIHNVALGAGWNMISSYVQPTDADVTDLFAPVAGSLVLVKNGAGGLYWPALGTNSIGAWDHQLGYVLYVTSATSVEFSGISVTPESTPIPLDAGWNYTAFWGKSAKDVVAATETVSSVLVAVKNIAGDIYLPGSGINDLGNMVPGQGYKVYVSSGANLTYPAYATEKGGYVAGKAGAGIGSSASVVVIGDKLREGDVIAAWDGARMVGSATVAEGRAVLKIRGDDPITASLDGASAGSHLQLRSGLNPEAAQIELNELRDALTNVQISTDDFRYQEDAIWIAKSGTVGPEVPLVFELKANYPNPFNPSTTIEYTLSEPGRTTLSMYNMLGQHIDTLVDEHQKEGRYRLTFEAADLPSGMYVYRLTSGEFAQHRSMLFLK